MATPERSVPGTIPCGQSGRSVFEFSSNPTKKIKRLTLGHTLGDLVIRWLSGAADCSPLLIVVFKGIEDLHEFVMAFLHIFRV